MPKERKIIRTKRIYKKRTRPRWVGTLLFLLLLALLIFLGYLVSREWSKRFGEGRPSSIPESSSVPLESELSSQPESSRPDSSLPESSPPEASENPLRGVRLSAGDMARTGTDLTAFLKALKEEGYTAVEAELKTEEGVITYPSAGELARAYGTVSETPVDLVALAAAVKAEGMVPIARISALKDPLAAHVSRDNSFGYNNNPKVNWLDDSPDRGGKPWLNPYMEDTRTYLAQLCKEAADMGFERILLTNVNFPVKNAAVSLGTLNEFTSRDEILNLVVETCQTAAGEVPVYDSYDPAFFASYRSGGGKRAPRIDLGAISGTSEAICAANGINPASAADGRVDLLIVETLLREDDLPVISQWDLEAVLPILEKKGIKSYLVV